MIPERKATAHRWPWRTIMDVATGIAFIVACSAVAWSSAVMSTRRVAVPARPLDGRAGSRSAEPALPPKPISLRGAAYEGQKSARIAIVEYSDFQCPFCGKFARETLPHIEEKYVAKGRVLVAFRHLPLAMHPFAEKAAEAAECAGRQGRFWEMHAQLFRNQQQLAIENLFRYASDIHLDPDLFGRCLNGEASQTVKDDVALATSFAISATPTFFVGVVQSDGQVKVTDRLAGAQPAQQFEAAVDKLLTANLSDARK